MICKCLQHKANFVEATAPRTNVEHTALGCWMVTHGKAPPATNRFGDALEPTPVTFVRLA